MPNDRVIIFDEAQRAWDAEQNKRKKRPHVSEAHMMLEVMSRHEGWAVLVCLIGGGQEINSGEAGLAEWGSALRSFEKWQVYASPEILAEKSEGPFLLFREEDPYPARIRAVDQFHLKVSNRSIRAQHISEWVNAVPSRGLRFGESYLLAKCLHPPALARNLSTVRAWLHGKRRGFTRAGLVASASASRLRADGIETAFGFHRDFEWERWFLDRDTCDESECRSYNIATTCARPQGWRWPRHNSRFRVWNWTGLACVGERILSGRTVAGQASTLAGKTGGQTRTIASISFA